jgi:P27 family predicted phage terminase small subunit
MINHLKWHGIKKKKAGNRIHNNDYWNRVDCQSYARWKEAQEHIDSDGSTFETDKGYQQQTPWVGIANSSQKLMLQAAFEFGLTPSSRSRIDAGNTKSKELKGEMEALLGGDS